MTLVLIVHGQEKTSDNNTELFFQSLRHLNFKEAGKLAEVSDELFSPALGIELVELLYDGGQNKPEDYYYSVRNLEMPLDEAMNYLKKGYIGLYYHSTDTLAFSHFNEAIKLAKVHNYRPLIKQCLMAQLELYYNEILQSNEEYNSILSEFKNYLDEDVDRFNFYLYESIFRAKSIFDIDELSSDNIKKLIDLIENERFQLSDGLKAKYYYEKGIHDTFDDRIQEAMINFDMALKFAKDPYLKYIRFGANLRKGILSSKELEYRKALNFLKKASKYYDKQDSVRSKFYVNRYASQFYEGLKKFDSANILLKKSIEQEYELQFRKNTMQISKLNVLYKTVEKEKQILIEQQRAASNRNWLIAAAIALTLGSGIAILLQKNTRKKRQLAEQTTLLEQQKVQTLLKEQELVSIDAMIEGQEKERQKVANELHDDLGSLMATVKLHFDNVKVDEKDLALQNAQKLLDEAYQKIRGMAHSKNSGVMANQGLLPAVQKMAKTINESNTLEIEVEDFGLADRMENSLELTIFRIIQELVANIIKHSDANKATIQFTQHEDKLNIIVEDNGKGFDMSAVKRASSGMGLGTIEKRIEHLEGSFTVDSVLEKGTSILIDIPV